MIECERRRIHTLTVTTTPKAWPRNLALAQSTKYIRPALGLHPQLVWERAHEIGLWAEYLPQARYVGEVGLDAGPRFYKSFDKQLEVFQQVLRKCAQVGDKIITVHSVRAVPKVLDLIEEHLGGHESCKVVMHWFTGSQAQAKRAIDLGCYFSINKEMFAKHSQMIESLPLDRLLTETDGPFTSNERNEPASPCDVAEVLEGLSNVLKLEVKYMADQIYRNLQTLER